MRNREEVRARRGTGYDVETSRSGAQGGSFVTSEFEFTNIGGVASFTVDGSHAFGGPVCRCPRIERALQ